MVVLVALLGASCGGSAAPRDTLAAAVMPAAAVEPGAPQVTVATLNLLHGIFCPTETDFCRAPARLEVLRAHLEDAGCPELVGLQEIGPRQAELIGVWLDEVCGGIYEAVWSGVTGIDRAMVLTSLPVLEAGLLDLANLPWEAVWVRVDAPGGTVDFLTAHFASSSNNPICDPGTCPEICPVGIDTNQCHAHEVVAFFAAIPQAADLSVVAGDLNTAPDERETLPTLLASGFVDAWAASGNPPCDPADGSGCTGGGDEPGTPLIGMDTAEGLPFTRRIDYVLVRSAETCRLEVAAAAFAATPIVPPIEGMHWASDHAGVLADLACR